MASNVISGMCRCCASEGTFKDMTTAYHWMGEEEVYDIMLRECFDISLTQADCDASDRGICEVCITQLRNASNFKKQVLLTEEQFKLRLENKLFKDEIVKIEPSKDEEYDSDDQNDVELEVEFAEVDYTGVVKDEEPEAPRTRKRAAKASTSRAKRSKADGETSKRSDEDSDTDTDTDSGKNTKKARVKGDYSRPQHISNIQAILDNSNATPIRYCIDGRYTCCFCSESFIEPCELKQHTISSHSDNNINNSSFGMTELRRLFISMDITDLTCNLCETPLNTITDLLNHLSNEHDKRIYNIKNQIAPFKFDSDILKCCVCFKKFRTFKLLKEHMGSHCDNYICKVCGAGFLTRHTQHVHSRRHIQGEYACQFCTKVFPSAAYKNTHERRVHTKILDLFQCGHCDMRFQYYQQKQRHLKEKHGIDQSVKCQACGKLYETPAKYRVHMRRDHLLDKKHECAECGKKFFRKMELDRHGATHTGVKAFVCPLCDKAYSTKYNLQLHIKSKH